jgi:hypothetical protein
MKPLSDIVSICIFCEEKFLTESFNPHKFCSHDCYWKWMKGKKGCKPQTGKIVKCNNCGKEVYKTLYSLKTNRHFFCSIKCKYKWRKGKKFEDTLVKIKPDKLKKIISESSMFRWKRIGYETIEHKNLKKGISLFLQSRGYETYFEVPVWIGKYFRITDVVGIKGQEKVAVECGSIGKGKIREYSDIFQWIIHIPYKGEIKYLKGLI